MKILLATPSLLPEVGGPAYMVGAIQRMLQQAGVATATFTQRGKGGLALPLFSTGDTFELVDVVHTFGAWTPFGHRVAARARWAKIPYVFCPMGMLEPWSLAQKRLKKQLTKSKRRLTTCSKSKISAL